jgi:hypothetical protein
MRQQRHAPPEVVMSPLREAVPQLINDSRLSQGLPEHVEDPAVLARVAALVRGQLRRETPEGLRVQTPSGQTATS